MTDKIQYGQNFDQAAPIISDLVPEREIKVYPYELVNANKSEEFIGEQTVSIVSISQDNLDLNNERLSVDDENGKYFMMLASITSDAKLDYSTSTSTLGQELKEEDTFTGLSNWYYEGELEDLQLGQERLVPAVFTIGKKFDRDLYEKGEQVLYLASTMSSAKDDDNETYDIQPEKLYEFMLSNITLLESNFVNSRILFIENEKFNRDVKTFPLKNGVQKNGLSISFENHTLLHAIKAKGKTSELIKGNKQVSEFGDIELLSQEKLAPFKMTPVSTQDKLSMYADWFDYDSVLPFVYAEKYKEGKTAKISDVITNDDDRKMVEDMLTVSDGFASSWANAPRDATGDNAGKIKPDFRIGWAALKVQAIENKDPIKVVDGLYEAHIRKFPLFTQNSERYQVVREMINALSRYIYSSYAIGRGQNSFNEAYLPWFLVPSDNTPISTQKEDNLPNPDYDKSAGTVTSYRMKDGVKFKISTVYFREEFSDDINIGKGSDLLLPTSVNLSNVKILQTDRKLTLPELPNTISGINKLQLPGDIDTKSSNSLNYIFYLPIQEQSIFEDFMLNSLQPKGTVSAGTRVKVNVTDETGRGVDGRVWTLQEAIDAVLFKQPGQIKVNPIVENPTAGLPVISTTLSTGDGSGVPGNVLVNGKQLIGLPETPNVIVDEIDLKKSIQRTFGYKDLDSIIILTNTLEYKPAAVAPRPGFLGKATFKVTHSEFTPAEVLITSSNGVRKFAFQNRETLFDKEQWMSFLSDFKIIPNGEIQYDLLHKKDVQHNTEFMIDELDEVIIYSVWGNYCKLKTGTGPNDIITIPLFNKDDETIGIQRIIFT